MRTTLTIDNDIFLAAKSLAESKTLSISQVVSYLMRKGLQQNTSFKQKNGFPTFKVSSKAKPITPEHVKMLEDEQ